MNLAIGTILGLMMGLALIVGWESLDRKLRMPDDVEADLGVPLLGALQAVTEQSQIPRSLLRPASRWPR